MAYFSKGDSYSVVRVFNLIFGEISSDDFAFDDENIINDIINLIIYLFFIYLISVIFLNLFFGIAIGELSEVLKESKAIQTKLRLKYIFSIQKIDFLNEKMILGNRIISKKESKKSLRKWLRK